MSNYSSTFEQFLSLETHLKETSKQNYKRILTKIHKELPNKNDFSKSNIITYLNSESFLKLEISSQNRYKTALKKYLSFLDQDHSFIQKTKEIQKSLSKEALLTSQEINTILNHMKRDLDKCLFMILLEGKIRIGEASTLKIKHFANKETHYNLYIEQSKSAQRTIPLVVSVPYIIQYLNNHPSKTDPESYFFVREYAGRIAGYSISGLRQIIIRNSRHIPKRVYPHLLRHTGLTNSAKYLSDSLLMQIAGWSTRTMIDKYVHLASDDLENKVLELHGIIPRSENENIETSITTKECQRCQLKNPGTNLLCSRCGSILDINFITKIQNKLSLEIGNFSIEEIINLFTKFVKESVLFK